MDPVTQALALASSLAQVYVSLLEAATPDQKRQLIDLWIADMKFLRGLADRLMPKG